MLSLPSRRAATSTVVFILSSSIASLAVDWVGDTSQDFTDPLNWADDNYPDKASEEDAVVGIDSGNFPIIFGDTTPVRDTIIGRGSSGRLDQRAGVHSTGGANWSYVGISGGTGTYNLADTATTDAGISGFGQGTGTFNAGDRVYIGGSLDTIGTGVVNINTTGSFNQSNQGENFAIYLGTGGGTGTLNLQGGTINSAQRFNVGSSGGTGTMNMTGGVVNTYESYLALQGSSTGVVNMSGGTWNVNHWMVVGEGAGSTGTFNLSGGTLNQNHTDFLSIGLGGGSGNFIQTGGVLNDLAVVDLSNRATMKGNVVVGRFGNGQGLWDISGDAVANIRELLIGEQATDVGRVNVSGNAFINSVDNDLVLARAGTGRVDLNGGSMNFNSGWVFIGQNEGARGTLNVNAGEISTNRYFIGQSGEGTVNVAGGTFIADEITTFGQAAAGRGTLNVTSGTANLEALAVGLNGTGTVTVSGGSLTTTGEVQVAQEAGGQGTFSLSGGVFSSTNNLQIGSRGGGTFTQTGGTLNANAFPSIGRYPGSTGTANLSGGTFNQVDVGRGLIIGEEGTGILNVSAGALLNASNFVIGQAANGNGTVNQTGGTVIIGQNIDVQSAGVGTYNLSGGVLSVNGTIDGTDGTFAFTGGRITRSDAGGIIFNGNLVLGNENAGFILDADKNFNIGGDFDVANGITLELAGRVIPTSMSDTFETGSFTLGTVIGLFTGTFDTATTNIFGLLNAANATFISETRGEEMNFNPNSDSVYWVQENGGTVSLQYSVVPEPSAFALFAAPGFALFGRRRRRK